VATGRPYKVVPSILAAWPIHAYRDLLGDGYNLNERRHQGRAE
jgi:hypothetical protein